MDPRSTAIILDLAREQQRAVLQQANELDAKAATLLGFAGLLLGLLFSSDVAATHWNTVFAAGAVMLGCSLIPLGITLFPRTVDANPDVGQLLVRDLERSPQELEWLVVLSLRRSVRAWLNMVRIKSRLVRGGSVLIVAAVLVIGGRFVYVLDASRGQSSWESIGSSYTYSHHD